MVLKWMMILNILQKIPQRPHTLFIFLSMTFIYHFQCEVISCLPKLKPAVQEIENCRWVLLTLETEWESHSVDFEENERKAFIWAPSKVFVWHPAIEFSSTMVCSLHCRDGS
jgi:hypothetical protein